TTHYEPLSTVSPSRFSSSRTPRTLHSFPTRRSSDLKGLTLKAKTTITYELKGAYKVFRALAGVADDPENFAPSQVKVTIDDGARSEEHTSELQSPCNLVCRLLLEKKKNNKLKEDQRR